ncbi:unnamed protein product [marine sediment metagenome]|uniref:Uncharacterized protein n=1 Tax=marine sediment metagenome TaxID=412755 RepID=X1K1X8_9ZZZZ
MTWVNLESQYQENFIKLVLYYSDFKAGGSKTDGYNIRYNSRDMFFSGCLGYL